jgi:hypothetical protein
MFLARKAVVPALGLMLVASMSLAGCSGSSPSPDVDAPSSTGSTGSAGTGAPVDSAPATARDGSSLLPSTEIGACSLLSRDQIREALGAAAKDIQAGEVAGTVSPSGVRHESCIYPLDTAGTTTHAVVLELVSYPDEASRASVDPWETMMSPTEVTGLWGEARYATNLLSQSTERVLAVAEGTKVWRFVISQPKESSTWGVSEGLAVLRTLAEMANI